MKLSIHGPSITGNQVTILLNGMDITADCLGLDLILSPGDLPHARIKFLVDDLDVSVDTLALLQAHVAEKESR